MNEPEAKNGAVAKWISMIVAFLVGSAAGIFAMYDTSRDARIAVERLAAKHDFEFAQIRKELDAASRLQILPGAAIRVAALEKDSVDTKERIRLLEEFKLEGGRFTIQQFKEFSADLRGNLKRLEEKIDGLNIKGATVEFRLQSLEGKDGK